MNAKVGQNDPKMRSISPSQKLTLKEVMIKVLVLQNEVFFMSAKSSNKTQTKNPYGDGSRRGRSGMLIVTVVVLLIACAAWITSYTRSLERSTVSPPQTVDPGAANATAPASR